jgi:hypothetical protein
VKINDDRVIGSGYAGTGSVKKAMLPIATGQELTVTSDGTSDAVNATFYPPIFVQKNAGNGSYSFDEVKTNDIWLDGKPIYKRTVYQNNNNIVLNNSTITLGDVFESNTYVDKVLKLEGYCSLPNNNNMHVGFIGFWLETRSHASFRAHYDKTLNNIILESAGGYLPVKDLTITLYYTKTSDQ